MFYFEIIIKLNLIDLLFQGLYYNCKQKLKKFLISLISLEKIYYFSNLFNYFFYYLNIDLINKKNTHKNFNRTQSAFINYLINKYMIWSEIF